MIKKSCLTIFDRNNCIIKNRYKEIIQNIFSQE